MQLTFSEPARDEYAPNSATFATNYTRRDAAILNILLKCEAAQDMGQHLIRREKLDLPQTARDEFALLAQGGRITASQAESLKHMVGFRNIAEHGYQAMQLPITVSIIKSNTARRHCCAMQGKVSNAKE